MEDQKEQNPILGCCGCICLILFCPIALPIFLIWYCCFMSKVQKTLDQEQKRMELELQRQELDNKQRQIELEERRLKGNTDNNEIKDNKVEKKETVILPPDNYEINVADTNKGSVRHHNDDINEYDGYRKKNSEINVEMVNNKDESVVSYKEDKDNQATPRSDKDKAPGF